MLGRGERFRWLSLLGSGSMLSLSAGLISTPRDNCPSMAVVDDNGAVACNCGKFGEEASAGVGLG